MTKHRYATKHGAASRKGKTRTYKLWLGMIARCTIPSATGYEQYGGKGVVVCERWRQFENFVADMGEAPDGLSIDRIRNEEGYQPGNCRWATRQEQNENRRSVRWLEVDGVRLTATAWARRLGLNKSSLYERLEKWTLRQALGYDAPPPIGRPHSAETKAKLSELAIKRHQARRDGAARS